MYPDPEDLRRRLEANPSDHGAFAALRSVYAEGGHLAALAELLEYRATYGTAGEEAGDLFLEAAEVWIDQLGDSERGTASLTKALERHPLHRKAGDRLDTFYRETGQTASLVQLLEQRIEALEARDPGGATARLRAHYHQQLGEIWESSYGRQDQAITHFRRAFELDPNNVMALYCAREIYQSAGNFQTAAKLLDLEARAEQDAGRRVALYRELAHTRAERLGDLEGAVVALKRALALEPSSPDVMGELALMLLRRAPMGGGDDDRMRAADLLYQIAAQSSPETALGYCEAALDAWPEHEAALDLFEERCDALGRTDLLLDRYRRLQDSLASSPAVWVVYRKLGALAHQVGSYAEAIACYEALQTLGDPSDRRTLEELYRITGRTEDLASLMSAELAEGPGESGAPPDPRALPRLRELVALLRTQGKDEEAEARMRDILALEPGDPEATAYLERRYRSRGDWRGLYGLLLAAGQSQVLPAAARVVRLREAAGIAEERLRDPDGAIACFSLAAVLAPDDPELRRHLDRLLLAHERWDELIDRMEADAARAVTPGEKIDQLRRIAEMHRVRRGDLADAAETYRRILELQPDDRGALEALDEIYVRLGDWQSLVDVLERRVEATAISAEKASLDLRIGAILHEQLDMPEEAYTACERALRSVPDKGPALARMEAIDTISGNWSRLLRTLEYRAELSGTAERAALLARAASLAADRLGDHERAVRLWQAVVDLDPLDPAPLSSLAAALDATGRWEEALATLERLAEATTEPEERLDVRRRVARILEERGEREEALRAWRLITDTADDPEALEALSLHLEADEAHEELVEVLRRLEALLEGDRRARSEAMLRLARALAGPLERSGEAVDVLGRLLEAVDPTSREALAMLRGVHVARGEFEEAARTAERELPLAEDSATKTELLLQCASWYRSEVRDLGRAIAANEKVLELDPYRSDVIAALEELYVETKDWERLLRLTRARYKATTDSEGLRRLLLAGAEICEARLADSGRAWGWYRELFDRLGDRPGVLAEVEAAAERLGLGLELIEVYGELTRTAKADAEQAAWWRKISAIYWERLEDPARALEAALRGYALDPNAAGALASIDTLALAAGAHERLVSVYDALLERDTDPIAQAGLRRRLAEVMLREGGKPVIAFDQLVEALELLPDDPALLRAVEEAARAAERWADLLDIYETHRDFAHDPELRVDMMLRSARVIVERLEAPDRAFALLADALAERPTDEDLAEEVSELVAALEARAPGDHKGLLYRRLVGLYRTMARSEDEDPDRQVLFLDRVARLEEEQLRDGRAAFETCRQATLLVPGHRPALERLERIADAHGLHRELAAHYASALEAVLDREAAIDLHRRRARILAEVLERPSDAADHYWQLIQIDPRDGGSRAALSAIYEQGKRWNDLVMLLERELPHADARRRREAMHQIARTWETRLRNGYEAQDAYRRILAEFPDDGEAREALDRLAKPSPGAGSFDDDALAELGLLEGASPPPPAFSAVPDDYLLAGALIASPPPPLPPPERTSEIEAAEVLDVDELEPLPEVEISVVEPDIDDGPPATDDIAAPEPATTPEGSPDFDRGPGGVRLAPPANPDSTSEIDVSQVEEVLDALPASFDEEMPGSFEQALGDEESIEELAPDELEDTTGDHRVGPPPLPSRPPPPPPPSDAAAHARPSCPPPLPPKK